jgi:probable phosphoglycerate mutase
VRDTARPAHRPDPIAASTGFWSTASKPFSSRDGRQHRHGRHRHPAPADGRSSGQVAVKENPHGALPDAGVPGAMPPLSVRLIRHAQTTANAGEVTDNHADIRLTALGEHQAREVMKTIAQAPDLIVVSPFRRTLDTAKPLIEAYPAAPVEIWPIEEFSYLAPARANRTSWVERKPMVAQYWERADPDYIDGADAESFVHFVGRLRAFHARLWQQEGRVVVFGHGQFLRAFALGLREGFSDSREAMLRFRKAETARPWRNTGTMVVSLPPPGEPSLKTLP